jgi:RimJ/RimL family protein N-acetyltransferase
VSAAEPLEPLEVVAVPARAALAYAFDDLGVDRVVSIRHRDNAASGRVMEKVGLRHDRDTPHPTLGLPLVVTAISREEWRGRA